MPETFTPGGSATKHIGSDHYEMYVVSVSESGHTVHVCRPSQAEEAAASAGVLGMFTPADVLRGIEVVNLRSGRPFPWHPIVTFTRRKNGRYVQTRCQTAPSLTPGNSDGDRLDPSF